MDEETPAACRLDMITHLLQSAVRTLRVRRVPRVDRRSVRDVAWVIMLPPACSEKVILFYGQTGAGRHRIRSRISGLIPPNGTLG